MMEWVIKNYDIIIALKFEWMSPTGIHIFQKARIFMKCHSHILGGLEYYKMPFT